MATSKPKACLLPFFPSTGTKAYWWYSINVNSGGLLPLSDPTAQTCVVPGTPATPLRLLLKGPGLGLETILQRVPFQCIIRVLPAGPLFAPFAPREPPPLGIPA